MHTVCYSPCWNWSSEYIADIRGSLSWLQRQPCTIRLLQLNDGVANSNPCVWQCNRCQLVRAHECMFQSSINAVYSFLRALCRCKSIGSHNNQAYYNQLQQQTSPGSGRMRRHHSTCMPCKNYHLLVRACARVQIHHPRVYRVLYRLLQDKYA